MLLTFQVKTSSVYVMIVVFYVKKTRLKYFNPISEFDYFQKSTIVENRCISEKESKIFSVFT